MLCPAQCTEWRRPLHTTRTEQKRVTVEPPAALRSDPSLRPPEGARGFEPHNITFMKEPGGVAGQGPPPPEPPEMDTQDVLDIKVRARCRAACATHTTPMGRHRAEGEVALP